MKSRNKRGGDRARAADVEFARALAGGSEQTRGRKRRHKTQQLCRQAQRALSLALAGECGDDLLRDLYVEDVQPAAGDASHLIVRVVVPSRQPPISVAEILQRLARVQPRLRRAVAEAITRKRAPELVFLPVAPGEVSP